MPLNTTERLTFDAVGIREALADKISDVTPEDVPFSSNLGTAPNPQSTRWDWLTQSLNAADNTNAQLEGNDMTTAPVSQPTRLYNIMQISTKALAVSGTLEATKRAGRAGELARAMMRAGIELKRDMESILVGTNQACVTGDASTARKTGSILAWIKTNTDIGAGSAANPIYTDHPSGTRTDGTQRVLTETMLKNVLKQKWANAGVPSKTVAYFGPVNIQRASSFVGIATQVQVDASEGKIYAVADVYKGQFETVYFIPNRLQRERDVLVISTAFAKLVKLRDFTPIDLAITGDNIKKGLVVEYGLQIDNELAHGGIFDLQTT